MLDGYLIANIFISVLLMALGGLVIIKSNRGQLNRLFLAFCFFTSAWLISNNLSNSKNLHLSSILIANHLVLFFSTLAIFCLTYFTVYFTGSRFLKKWVHLAVLINFMVAFLTLTPLAIKDVSIQQSASAISFGPLASLYFLLIAFNTFMIFSSLRYGLKKSRGQERQRILAIAWSFVLMLGIIIALNAIVPLLTGSFNLTNVGPLAVIILAAGISYSMIKHRLFDIRSFVVRAAVYFLTFSVLALLYVVPSIVLAGTILNANFNAPTYLVIVVITLFTSLLFQPLRQSFNKLTSKVFYRDYYEPQDVLDKVSSLLVGSVDLQQIERESANIIRNALKPSKLKYLLVAKHDGDEFLRLLKSSRKDVLIEEDLSDSSHSGLVEMMKDQDIALAIRLQTNQENLGFMLLGYKQSGSSYSSSDMKLLSIVADEIAVGLQNALRFEEIKRFNTTLEQKVDDATKQLRHANARLKELDKTKNEFISMASHQLRTPLTTIKGYLSMILDGDVGKVKAAEKDMVQQAYDSAQNMVDLIADLLNVSRLQSGKFVIENKPTDLADMVDREIKKLTEQAANRKLKLIYEKPASIPILSLDETKIRQVVMNFIDNAIYYTPAGGTIRVALQASPQSVEYTVTDTGVGVPKEVQHHLFSKFYRADNAKKMRPDGTGLGLFMAKKVIIAQGGVLIFKSEEGKGSTFGFSFPRKTTEVK